MTYVGKCSHKKSEGVAVEWLAANPNATTIDDRGLPTICSLKAFREKWTEAQNC